MNAATPLTVVYRPLAELVPYARNARTHSDEQVAAIAANVSAYGWTNPILVDERGGVIAGHGRLRAAQLLGMAEVPTICLAGLTEAQRRALVLADNRLAELSGWDEALLAEELKAVALDMDVGLLGFSDDDMRALERSLGEGFGSPPPSVTQNAAHVAEIRAQRKNGNANTASKNDTERYLVVVFASRESREAMAQRLGLPGDERYIAAEAVDLRRRFAVAAEVPAPRKTKAAASRNSGAGG